MIRMRHFGRAGRLIAAVMFMTLLTVAHASAFTLDQVRLRDELLCGVASDLPGFSKADSEGTWHGINVDICRAVAAAVLGDSSKVRFVPLNQNDAITSLLSGEADLLSMNLGWNLSYDTSVGIHFCGVTFYDGLGFMVPVKSEIGSALELGNSSICHEPVESVEAGLDKFFASHNLSYRKVEFAGEQAFRSALQSAQCEVISGNLSRLAILRMGLPQPESYQILPETILRRPLGPAVRQGDDGWFNVVRWVLFILKIAEDEGLTSANLEIMKSSTDTDIRRLLGLEGIKGTGLGLSDDWVIRVISQVGNYGEIFERTLGRNSPIKMERHLNEIWSRGGLHYGPAID
ncbi:MAG: transporter substrate-binding domain-containing protein [Desulfofustis sp.]|nr:transporter substrate-binding domain-containing protein [Desulfofustis sp.]